MGWFNNKMTTDRAVNTLGIAASMASLEQTKETLTAANDFVSGQKQRASRLASQAFSVQGASSHTGRSLQQAINDLSDYQRDGREILEDVNTRMVVVAGIAQQFSTPRFFRDLNMSGADMSDAMIDNARQALENLARLKDNHQDKVTNAVWTIDNADQELNGSSSTRALGRLPSFN